MKISCNKLLNKSYQLLVKKNISDTKICSYTEKYGYITT